VARLSLYVRELTRLNAKRVEFVSSRRLAQQLGLTDAQVRRDLSYFGQFGTSGRGYEVERLHGRLTSILGVAGRTWNVALAGVGNLGSALLAYGGFKERGFSFRAAVDDDPGKIGRTICGVAVSSPQLLRALIKQHHIQIGLIAVPAETAQAVCDEFVRSGVRAIVNFAPVRLKVPPSVWLRAVDLAVELESLAFYLAGTK
jgi:redox-sensing transcriptional repressor